MLFIDLTLSRQKNCSMRTAASAKHKVHPQSPPSKHKVHPQGPPLQHKVVLLPVLLLPVLLPVLLPGQTYVGGSEEK